MLTSKNFKDRFKLNNNHTFFNILNSPSFLKLQRRTLGHLIIYCCIFFSGFSNTTFANFYPLEPQQIYFNNLDAETFLIQPLIQAIEQDKQGFIWLGTQDGLERFDGKNMHHYNVVQGDSTSLLNNWVRDVHSDSQGRIWIATRGGINLYLSDNDAFKRFAPSQQYPTLKSKDFLAIAEQKSGSLWFASSKQGIYEYDTASDKFTRFMHNPVDPNSIASNSVSSLLVDRNDNLWVGTKAHGISIKKAGEKNFHHLANGRGKFKLIKSISSLYEDSEGMIWIATFEDGVFTYHPENGFQDHFKHDKENNSSLCANAIEDILQDSEGRMWFASDNGLCQYIASSNKFYPHQHELGRISSLLDNRVKTLFQDLGGVMWVGTMGGVSNWNAALGKFVHISKNFGIGKGLSSNVITAFSQDSKENLYIGTFGGGVNKINIDSGSITTLTPTNSSEAVNSNQVMSLLTDHNDNLWVGTFQHGLFKQKVDQTSFENYRHIADQPKSIGSNGISKIIQLNDKRLAVGTYGGGLNIMNNDGSFTRFQHNPKQAGSLSNDYVLDIVQSEDGDIWVATDGGGLNKFDISAEKFQHYLPSSQVKGALQSLAIYTILETNDYLWLGTQEMGLARLDKKQLAKGQTIFEHFMINDGLPSNSIYGLVEAPNGQIWFSHSRGLSKFDPLDNAVQNFTVSHGTQGRDFNAGAYFQADNGRIFFGGSNGFNTFLQNEVEINKYQAPVRLVGFSEFGQTVPMQQAFQRNGLLELNHSSSHFTFEFSALDFTKPSDNLYQYKMEGLGEKWIMNNKNNRVSFYNLFEGKYKFRVKAANSDAHWSDQELVIPINILPPPSRTWWAYSLYTLALFALLLTFIRTQRKKVKFERRLNFQLEQKVDEKTKSLKQVNLKLEELSYTDQLTGLRNRRFLSSNIQSEVDLVLRTYRSRETGSDQHSDAVKLKDADLIFFLIDLDNFKEVNDVHGHSAGDAVLIQIKAILEKVFRENDYLVRWGGEEFLVVARFTDRNKGADLAERLRRAVEHHPFDIGNGKMLSKTCSIGFAAFPLLSTNPSGMSWERTIEIADLCMYSAKKSSRNAWVGITHIHADDADLLINFAEKTDQLIESGNLTVLSSIKNKRKTI